MERDIKYCSVCGSENPVSAKFCSSCGAKLDTKEPSKSSDTESKNSSGNKELSQTTIIMSIVGLVAIGIIILYVSGVFDTPAVSNNVPVQNQFNSQQNNPHSGVDLNALQKIKDLEIYLSNHPDDMESLLNLAHLLNDAGFKLKAIEKYKEYLAKKPNDPVALIDMGVCYYELGKYDEALKYMKQAIEIDPNHQIGLFNIGIVTSAKGNNAEAKKWWQKAVDVNPNANIAQKAKNLINQN